MQSEHEIQKQIQLAVSKQHHKIYRANVGKVQMKDGRWFDTGLPQGFPDLFGTRYPDNQSFYIEVKNRTGRIRDDQIRFHDMLVKQKTIHGIARSVDDALNIVNNGLIGYGY